VTSRINRRFLVISVADAKRNITFALIAPVVAQNTIYYHSSPVTDGVIGVYAINGQRVPIVM